MELIREFFVVLCKVLIYFSIALVVLISTKIIVPKAREGYRKLMHLFGAFSVIVFLTSNKWFISAILLFIFLITVFFGLFLFENSKAYKKLVIERKKGEVKYTFILSFTTLLLLTIIYWAFLGDTYKPIIYIAYLSWGVGDAVAALVGQTFGHRYFKPSILNNKKTREGTIAMSIAVFAVSLVILYIFNRGYSPVIYIVSSLVLALTASVTELISSDYLDTITVPFVTSIVALILYQIFFIN